MAVIISIFIFTILIHNIHYLKKKKVMDCSFNEK